MSWPCHRDIMVVRGYAIRVLTQSAPAAPSGAKVRPPRTAKDFYTSRLRLAVVLVLCFAVLPSVLLLTTGVLMLVFRARATDVLFGTLILSFAAALIAGVTFTFLFVRRATSLARLQTEFVQKVSHDLRTPLTSIRLFVETLQSGRLSPTDVKESLEVLNSETARLSAMVERLLKWASMEAGKRIYNPVTVAPAKFIAKALQALEPQIKIAQRMGTVEVTTEVADSLPSVDVDPDAMTEALLNVLHNAIRYTGPDKQVRLRAVRREREVEITVSDNGPGIPLKDQRYIFQKFYRVVDPARPNVDGTGLGLSMVHHIVGAHGGRIVVDSEPGKGATFRISLPIAQGEEDLYA